MTWFLLLLYLFDRHLIFHFFHTLYVAYELAHQILLRAILSHTLQGSPAADDSQNDNHQCDYQKNVNKTAQCVGCDKSRQPQYKQNYGNCNKHDYCPSDP
jgi:hypothetical protein